MIFAKFSQKADSFSTNGSHWSPKN